MKIAVKSFPVKEVMKDFSNEFKTTLQEDSGEFTLQLPGKYGEGFIRGSGFDSGIGIIEYKCTFYTDLQVVFSRNQTHPLKFIFCSKGKIEHSFEGDDDFHLIDTFQNCIVSSSRQKGHVLFFKANETVHVSSLEIVRSLFWDRKNYNFENLSPELQELFADSDAVKKFYYHGNYSIKAADIVEAISNKQNTGFLRSILLEGKLFEMLAHQIKQFEDDQDNEKQAYILRRSDIEKVRRVVEIIHEDLSQNLTVDYLAKEVGTNVNKLQEGFKYLFDLTVNKYIKQVKLEKAKELLTNSNHNVSQIVDQIGLNNRSYFSKVFKEKYGVSPKYFSQNRLGDEDGTTDEID